MLLQIVESNAVSELYQSSTVEAWYNIIRQILGKCVKIWGIFRVENPGVTLLLFGSL